MPSKTAGLRMATPYSFQPKPLHLRGQHHLQLDPKTMQEKTVPESQGHLGVRVSPDGKYLTAATVDGEKLLIFDIGAQKWSELGQSA